MPKFDIPARFPSGQRGRTVNPLAQPSQVRILLSPPVFCSGWRCEITKIINSAKKLIYRFDINDKKVKINRTKVQSH